MYFLYFFLHLNSINFNRYLKHNTMTTVKSKVWHVIYIRSRAEKKVLADLTAKGITCFMPVQKKLRQWKDRKKLVEMPNMLNYKSVLITGGTGSFGKKFIETILNRYPEVKRIVIYSRDELKQSILKQKYPANKYPQLRFLLGMYVMQPG